MTSEPGSEDRPAVHPVGNPAAMVSHPAARVAMARLRLRRNPATANHRNALVTIAPHRHHRRVAMALRLHNKAVMVSRLHRKVAIALPHPSRVGTGNPLRHQSATGSRHNDRAGTELRLHNKAVIVSRLHRKVAMALPHLSRAGTARHRPRIPVVRGHEQLRSMSML